MDCGGMCRDGSPERCRDSDTEVQTLAQSHGGYLLFSYAENTARLEEGLLRFPASHKTPRPGLWLLLLWQLLSASLLDVSA